MKIIMDLVSLQAAYRRKAKLKYLPFWGHILEQAGRVDKAVLSQWFPVVFEIEGIAYPTAEHYMMAQKARLFGDEVIFRKIIAGGSPKQVKALGRQIQGFSEKIWCEKREEIVFQGNLAKFSQHSALKDFLLSTGNKILVEASPVDKIWGIGMSADDTRLANPLQWQGLNLLGFALMKVRDQLQGLSERPTLLRKE